MTISLKHSYTAIGPGAGDGEVGVSEWNEEHTLTMASGKLLGRSTAGTGAAEEITVGTGLSLSGGTLTSSGGAAAGSEGAVQISDGSGGFTSNSQITGKRFIQADGLFVGSEYSPVEPFLWAGSYRHDYGFAGVFVEGGDYTKFTSFAELSADLNAFGGVLNISGIEHSSGYTGAVHVIIQAPTGGSYDYTLTLPTSAGSSGQALTTDGSGTLSWSDPAKSSAPASASATGRAGEIRYDSGYVYVCVATDTWKRAALSTW